MSFQLLTGRLFNSVSIVYGVIYHSFLQSSAAISRVHTLPGPSSRRRRVTNIIARGQSIANSRSVYICLWICLSARIFQKANDLTSPNFMYILSMVLARFFSDGNTMRYVLPVM